MSRYIIVGAGGVGGWLASGLARMVEYADPGSLLVIVDGDTFEPKNLNRQDFTTYGNKAEVRAGELQPMFPSTVIIGLGQWVVAEHELREKAGKSDEEESDTLAKPSHVLVHDLIEDGDVVCAVVDNFAARKVIFDHARTLDNIDIFTGGNDDNLYGSVYHYRRREGEDITDHPEIMHSEYDNPPDRNPGVLSCSERAAIEGGTQLLATNQAVSAFMLGRIHHTIFAEAENIAEHAEIFFDLSIGVATAYARKPDPVPQTTGATT